MAKGQRNPVPVATLQILPKNVHAIPPKFKNTWRGYRDHCLTV